MGAIAIRRALADAGVEWRDIQFAFAGSYEVDNPDAVVALLGLTGIPFTDVYNGCATAASALTLAANTIRLGEHDLGIAVGMDKHLPGAFTADPRLYACPSWYGEVGQFLTTKFFGMKINKYMHDHGISHETLAKVAAKNYRNGALNPNAFRRKPMSEEEILGSPMLNYPLTQYMFCSPDEGAAAVVLCRAENAHRYTDTADLPRATTVRTRRLGAFEVHSPWLPIEQTVGPTVDASRAAYEMAGIGPEDVDVIQLQDTDAGAEVIHLAENGFCADGEQEKLRRRRRDRDRRRAAGQHRRRAHRERRADRRVGPAPGARSRAAAARPGRRAPGARQPEGRLHAALRRTRHRRRLDHVDLMVATTTDPQLREEMIATVRTFIAREVIPVASAMEHADEFPAAIVEQMKAIGLFGITIPEEYGGLGLDLLTYIGVVEELAYGWMSLSGIINTHTIARVLDRASRHRRAEGAVAAADGVRASCAVACRCRSPMPAAIPATSRARRFATARST